MKRIFSYGIILASISVLMIACQPDDDTTPDVTGDVRDKIEATWRSQENSTTYGQQNYYVDIEKDTASSTGIKIDNFFNLGLGKKMNATVSGNTITLGSQPFEGFVFSGNGTISSNYNSISWSYTFFDGNETETVTGTYTKL